MYSFLFSEMALRNLSESLYVILCLKIGVPQQVTIRRDVVDIKEFLQHEVTKTDSVVFMVSGSQREGFRFKDSDLDLMYWPNYQRVLQCTIHKDMH